jgi:DNA invertase Pin-like site-specific DNA recombinase
MTAVSAKALRRGHLPSGKQDEKLLTTVAMLKERGIALLSLEERIDTNSAAGELVFHVFGAIAHFERCLSAERPRMELPPPVRRASIRDADPSMLTRSPPRSDW